MKLNTKIMITSIETADRQSIIVSCDKKGNLDCRLDDDAIFEELKYNVAKR